MYAVQSNVTTAFEPTGGGQSGSVPIVPGQTSYLNGSVPASGDGVAPGPWSNPGFSTPNMPGVGTGGAATGSTNGGGFIGLINNLIAQLGTMIAQMGGIPGTGSSSGTPTQNVANATFQSWGDPHLSETGTLNSGTGTTTVNTHFDSMTGHADLLDSAAFAGGYQLSTSVTSPNAAGVTHNQSATIQLNGGRDSVTMNEDGTYSVATDGTPLSLTAGQPVQLSGGASVTLGTNGSLDVSVHNGSGGTIATTLTAQGGGVNVSANVANVTVGGDIVAQNQTASATTSPAPTTSVTPTAPQFA